VREPRLIPIYDDTEPVACTLTAAEIPERLALIERLRSALLSLDRTPTGLLLHFHTELRGDLAAFAVDEKQCCRFWGFEVTEEPAGVALRWDGPPAADELLDRLHTFFTTDAPLTALDGLL
jgi:hypothetical protein